MAYGFNDLSQVLRDIDNYLSNKADWDDDGEPNEEAVLSERLSPYLRATRSIELKALMEALDVKGPI